MQCKNKILLLRDQHSDKKVFNRMREKKFKVMEESKNGVENEVKPTVTDGRPTDTGSNIMLTKANIIFLNSITNDESMIKLLWL